MKTILVTGGAGFIGCHLIERLLQDSEVHVICLDNLITGGLHRMEPFMENERFSFVEHDICDYFEIDHVDEIYHLASIASPVKYKKYPIETLLTSINGTQQVLQLCLQHQCKLLFTSTSEVYGDPQVHPQPEDYFGNVNTVGERSCYDEGKRVVETLLYEFRKQYSLDLKIVRIFNTYGPQMDIDDGRVITNFISRILADQPIQIYGDGTQTRSFCYIDDMVTGLIKMMESNEQGPINLGNPHCEFTLNELVHEFEKVMGRSLPVEYLPSTPDDPKCRKPIITKAQSKLQWNPSTPLRQGILQTAQYFQRLQVAS